MTVLEQVQALRNALDVLAENASDAIASVTVVAFPRLKENGELVKAGVRINWKGVVKKAAVDLWDTVENNPDNAPTLWEDIPYKEGYRIIPEIITVTTAFAEGECGWWENILYRSKVSGNVYTPAIYPDNWEKVGE